MQHDRNDTVTALPTTRSKVSNGTRLLANVDLRSSSARRFRDLVRSFEAELGGQLSELERGMVKQAAALSLKTEQMQEAIVRGDTVDSDALIRLSSEARRILTSLRKRTGRANAAAPSDIGDLVA